MELYLQLGHGMMGHTDALLKNWGGGGAILSPRDLDHEQLVRVAESVRSLDCEPLLDPQCFLRDADHHRLTEHQYWKVYKRSSSTAGLLSGAPRLIEALAALNSELGTGRVILPGLLAEPVSEEWLSIHEALAETARNEMGGASLVATVSLSYGSIMDESQVEAVVDRATAWPVDGYYLIAEVPGAYLVDDPNWVANVLILASGLKLSGRHVIQGYSNHQLLCLAACNLDAMAAGTWLNCRAFDPKKFLNPEGDEISRRATWYYCPQALSEYRLPFLDIAKRNGALERMATEPTLGSHYSDALFTGPDPTSVEWGERDAFRHYLSCLRSQALAVASESYAGAMEKQHELLDSAERMIRDLRRQGVLGQGRSFQDAIDANRGALATLNRARGPRLRREWT